MAQAKLELGGQQELNLAPGEAEGAQGAQAAVDTDSLIIVAGRVTQDANDQHQQNPMLDKVHENTGSYPEKLVEDAGYWNQGEIQKTPAGVDLFVATTQDWKRRKALRDAGPPRGRIPNNLSLKERMERKLRTKNGHATYRLRGQTIEPTFGRIKEDQRIRGFLLRGLRKVAPGMGLDDHGRQRQAHVAPGHPDMTSGPPPT